VRGHRNRFGCPGASRRRTLARKDRRQSMRIEQKWSTSSQVAPDLNRERFPSPQGVP
jgi:hypothetical protein